MTVLRPVSVAVARQHCGAAAGAGSCGVGILVAQRRPGVRRYAGRGAVGCAEPATARNQVQAAVSAIRRQLRDLGAPELLVGSAAGYPLRPGREQVDLLAFRDAVVRAEREARCGRLTDASETLRNALALWVRPILAVRPERT